MNAERLRELVDKLLKAESESDIQGKLAQTRDYLNNLIQNAQQPQFQTHLAASLDQLRIAMKQFLEKFTPAQIKSFDDIRATSVFVADVAAVVDKLIRDNPMTPQVALTKINEIVSQRDVYRTVLRELQNKLQTIGIEPNTVESGEAEIGILLPRELFQNHLTELIGELRVANRVIRSGLSNALE